MIVGRESCKWMNMENLIARDFCRVNQADGWILYFGWESNRRQMELY